LHGENAVHLLCIPKKLDVPSKMKVKGYMYPLMKKPVGMLLLFNANSAILQLYHGKNKLIFNEMMRDALY
jgi:hypothetical protein